jgi:DNA repair protein RadD
MIPVLRPFQDSLVDRVRAARKEGNRIVVVQGATGCGKNTIAAYIVRQSWLKGSRILFMVHRRKLVEQIDDRLNQFEVPHTILMRGESYDSTSNVCVASRDTLLSRCVQNEWLGLPPADLVLVDEAHHAAAPESEYRKIINQYPNATVLLLSATPVGPDGRGLGPWAQAIECAAPTSQLVADGFLCPVKCFAPDRKTKGKRYVRGIAGDLVESWKQYGEGLPTVLFCARVQHSLDAVKAYQEAGIPAAHVDADTDDYERERIFDQIADGRIKILSNVGIVGEGVDVPELGCCQLFCEMGSRVRFLQACGRVMRTLPGKTHGILIDHSGAVFKHGFPDEDTHWTLEGSPDEDFKKAKDEGKTEKAFYCKRCELVYHGSQECPQCGRAPAKPPRSIFEPPPVDASNELLVEADRKAERGVFSKDEKIKHWLICLGVSANSNGDFKKASVIYKKKYNEWPGDDFPCLPSWKDRGNKVADMYPKFIRRKQHA